MSIAGATQATRERRSVRFRVSPHAVIFVVVAALLGLSFTLGFLTPLSFDRFPDPFRDERPLATALGSDTAGMFRWIGAVATSFLLFGGAVWLARRLSGRGWLAFVLLCGVVYAGLLVPTNPVGAQDIYHNVFDARILWKYGENPNLVPPIAFATDPLYKDVTAWEDFTSVYGPVWYVVTGVAHAVAGDDLRANLIAHKILTAAFLVATALICALIAERLRAGTAVAAAVVVAWNPLALFETAGNAHNDIVMLCFAVAAYLALVHRRWLLVFPLLALAIAAKYVVALLGPVILLWMWRNKDVSTKQLLASLALGLVVGLAVYAPFFEGRATFEAFGRQAAYATSSPSAWFDAALITWFDMLPEKSLTLTKMLVTPLFVLVYLWLLWWMGGSTTGIVSTSLLSCFFLLLIATWWFWPWYTLWTIPFAAMVIHRRSAAVILVFCASSMLMYAPYFWYLYGDGMLLQTYTAAVAFLPPVLLALILNGRRWFRTLSRLRRAWLIAAEMETA